MSSCLFQNSYCQRHFFKNSRINLLIYRLLRFFLPSDVLNSFRRKYDSNQNVQSTKIFYSAWVWIIPLEYVLRIISIQGVLEVNNKSVSDNRQKDSFTLSVYKYLNWNWVFNESFSELLVKVWVNFTRRMMVKATQCIFRITYLPAWWWLLEHPV